MSYAASYKIGKCLIASFGLLMLLTSGCSVAKEQTALSLTIAVPMHKGQRTIQVGREAKPFHVIIENLSDRQINLWRERYSWGYFNLSFEITDEKGATWTVKKKEIDWEKNFPDYVAIGPKEKKVIDVSFNPDIWQSVLPSGATQRTMVSMVAIYESEGSKDASERDVWSGRLVSDKKQYTLLYLD